PTPGTDCFAVPNDDAGNTFDPKSAFIIRQNQKYDRRSYVSIFSDEKHLDIQSEDIGVNFHFQYIGHPDTLIRDFGSNTTPVEPPAWECSGVNGEGDPYTRLIGITHNNPLNTILYSGIERGDGSVANKICQVFSD